MMNQTYTYAADSATIYKTWGKGGMDTGFYTYNNSTIAIEFKTQHKDGSIKTMTVEYKVGMEGSTLIFTSN